ncbi:hypothetical protein [Pseudoalteromonas peptidolytica]|uniref:Carboxypeptidase regulatory-like domain-containing protein n=1 Tax=Pseudoalteromonas peptidolytica F12-50-A1 TaxID=1315280 RepID=A0A8I0T5J8_9GAMM|nr:hypothetical protein [Pseudoalteromonas peptidolytica]MBE0347328.1 hypothetical protein [Pseudoalteromonas peptidolytica F12-50-A1]NLR13960.1 hypothetical protein [Pseudoalteromonas peptidolytica]GEK09908.1 hypothetical protein PPE03_21570 [Pseudoalteromonas peptidolytica]
MITNKKSLLALSVASALTLSGCFSDDDNNVTIPPTEPTDPVVVAPEAPAALSVVVNGSVVDSKSTNVVPSTIAFLENGEASDNIVNTKGEVIASVETGEAGNFVFSVKEGAELSQITAVVSADGYFSKSFNIDLTTEAEVAELAVQLALVSKNLDTVVEKVVEASVAGGSVDTAITAEAAKGKAGADVTIPAGIVLQDANGNPITGSSISLNVGSADPTSSDAGAVLPEGLNAGSAATLAAPVGVANVTMTDDNGVKIKKFSNPISITISIPKDTVLASEGRAVQTGDVLGLSSHNEDTGVWTKEENNQVTVGDLNAAGTAYKASFMTDHLTFFTATDEVDVCNAEVSVNISGEVPAGGLFVDVQSSDINATSSIAAGATTKVIYTAQNAGKNNVSADATARIVLRDAEGTVWFDTEEEVAVCGTPVNATLAAPQVEYATTSFALTGVCSNDATVTVPVQNSVVTYRRAGKATYQAANASGTYTLNNLVVGQDYTVNIDTLSLDVASGQSTSFSFTAGSDAADQQLQMVCETVTGA